MYKPKQSKTNRKEKYQRGTSTSEGVEEGTIASFDCGVWEYFVEEIHVEAALEEPRTLGFFALKLVLISCNTLSFPNPF